MTEYWVSQSRKFCEFCKCWITDNKPSIQFHENGKKHKENVQIRLKEISKKSAQDQKAQAKADQDMKKMEKEALKAYLKDVESNPDFTSRMLLEKKKLEQEPQKSSKSGPSCTENLSTNQNSEKQKIPPKIWYEAKSDENYTYYWNIETGESKWEIPDGGFLSLEEQQKMSESKKSNTEDKQHGNSNKTSKLAEKSQPKNKKKSEKHETSDKLQSEESKLIGPIEKPDPYGAWTDVKKEEIDVSELGLPQTEYVAIKVPSLQESEPKITFKEKTITSLYNKSQISMVEDIPIKSEEPQFKRRKITKGNIRQRTDD